MAETRAACAAGLDSATPCCEGAVVPEDVDAPGDVDTPGDVDEGVDVVDELDVPPLPPPQLEMISEDAVAATSRA